MACPLCRQRKARRHCPALGESICTVCCATKRLVEIECPDDCPHLSAAREHPPAQVKRQQERDVSALLPSIRQLSERQHQLFFLFHTAIARHKPEGFSRLVDEDVAQAAGSLAATLETAQRGVIYEHTPNSTTARRLFNDLVTLLEQIREKGGTVYDGEAAIVLRAIEEGARDLQRVEKTETAYLSLMARLLRVRNMQQPESPGDPARRQSTLILP
jgi:hypothetical protein